MSKIWNILALTVAPSDAESASALIAELDCNGIEVDESAKDERIRLLAYFDPAVEEIGTIEGRIREMLSAWKIRPLALSLDTADLDDWREKWRQWFHPFEIAPGIIIAPSWEAPDNPREAHVITLDPGMAFGTGIHPTTRLCAEAIATKREEGGIDSLLDVGTGSGILSLVGRALGISRIAGVENDPDALTVARENFAINGCADIETGLDFTSIDGTFDLVVANILLRPLLGLRDALLERVAPGGTLILSGITNDQEEDLAEAFAPPLTLATKTQREEWSCLVFHR